MIVAGDGKGLDTSADQKIHEDRLHFRLATLEIVAGNERLQRRHLVG